MLIDVLKLFTWALTFSVCRYYSITFCNNFEIYVFIVRTYLIISLLCGEPRKHVWFSWGHGCVIIVFNYCYCESLSFEHCSVCINCHHCGNTFSVIGFCSRIGPYSLELWGNLLFWNIVVACGACLIAYIYLACLTLVLASAGASGCSARRLRC